MLPLDENWSRRIAQGADEAELVQRMREEKLTSLVQDGIAKIMAGTTSVRETLSAVTSW
jgi:type II secretory ATPase GspE/PulE/Tfp pilus assembly ATPase PilB-like protein